MRSFEILDGRRRKAPVRAVLRHDEDSDRFSVSICPGTRPEELPAILGELLAKGVTEVDEPWARRFVEDRIVPSSRQNLGAVLKANGLEAYDELALLLAGDGRCAQDDFYLREIPDEPSPSDAERIGARIAELRRAHGWSQAVLASRAGLDQAQVSRIEQGKANPTLSVLSALADALGAQLELR